MTKLTLTFSDEPQKNGEPGVRISWAISKSDDQPMNELAELVKDTLFETMNKAINELEIKGEKNAIH
ncbi:TPA: hypothetical protein SD634_003359 [Vibrio cholerae]|nr:hypothetical protein [Vibrio cholerae]